MGSLAIESVLYVVVSDRLASAVICENTLPHQKSRLVSSKIDGPRLVILKISVDSYNSKLCAIL